MANQLDKIPAYRFDHPSINSIRGRTGELCVLVSAVGTTLGFSGRPEPPLSPESIRALGKG